ncbi:hypothetical protein ASPACDRAFT_43592 [Aspergillus aculeatus ATCC 16872]|uniref:DUF4396 domain-containing protein n=1 Tax=Aspergillus aculeatus (strain ATCC 16872 / CBS 172.66 / WB 5094) TaxID=690307 RepID=A0A1L9WUL4_ASPA1|nr:uncharacterized protein ASPACDRAFT_43592 [Aspergillus aculeatus ATCC 16872]OJJ99954.1 hypothetical protein ASPACDRAFT_43592 [Aspergillus aculeatus ATCC 16872]
MYLHCRSVITRRTRLPPSLSSLLGSRIPPASPAPRPSTSSILSRSFWTCRSSWKRARINTLRCLIGCTIGDFSALWMLQSFAPDLGMGTIMGLSMASGITTSVMLETYLLWRGADQLSLPMACRTAMGMSMVSMLAMEIAENAVDYHLTGGVVDVGDPRFWLAAGVSVGAGYLAPLPYNYWRLRKYGKACH